MGQTDTTKRHFGELPETVVEVIFHQQWIDVGAKIEIGTSLMVQYNINNDSGH